MIPGVQKFSWQQRTGPEVLQRVHTLFLLLPNLLFYHIFVYLFVTYKSISLLFLYFSTHLSLIVVYLSAVLFSWCILIHANNVNVFGIHSGGHVLISIVLKIYKPILFLNYLRLLKQNCHC